MPIPLIRFVVAAALMAAAASHSHTLRVGPGQRFTKPSQAAAFASNRDTVVFAAMDYAKDAAVWNPSNLVLRADSGFAHMRADGANAQGKGIWVIRGNNTVVENIEFSGAVVPDKNGAGIRQEGLNLTVRHCFFHDNENGILTTAGNSDVTVENCEFARNGFGDGYSHNIYINQVKSFTMRYCYTHHAKVGHNIKSRAEKNFILCNRSSDGMDGTASYELDLPNGGLAVIVGNVFQQGPATENATLLSYGEEGFASKDNRVFIVNNTFVNDCKNGGTFITLANSAPQPAAAKVVNNLFVGPGTLINGKADTAGNVATKKPGFVDRAGADYHLAPISPAVGKGVDPGTFEGLSLLPETEFDPAATASEKVRPRARKKTVDVGAFGMP